MSRKKPFQTTAILFGDGELEVMGGPLREVKALVARMRVPGARAIVVREVVKESASCPESSLVAYGTHLLKKRSRR